MVRVLLVLLAMAVAGTAPAAAPSPANGTPGVLVIDHADFVLDNSPRPPPDSAPWQPVHLPDNWHTTRPGTQGVGWYRIRLDLKAPRTGVYPYYLPRNSANHITFYAGDTIIAGTLGLPDPRARSNQLPLQFAIAPTLLKVGENRFYVRVQADADYRQGLTRVMFGDGMPIRRLYLGRYILQVESVVVLCFAALVVGIGGLAVWFAQRQDRTLLWFAVTGICAGLPALEHLLIGAIHDAPLREMFWMLSSHAYAPALAVASLRAVNKRLPWSEALLWLLLAGSTAAPAIFGEGSYPRLAGPVTAAFFTALSVSLLYLVQRAARQEPMTVAVLVVTHAAAIGFGAHDWMAWQGWIDFDAPNLFQFAPPVLTAGLGVMLVSRHVRAVDALTAMNRELDARVAERTAEVRHGYAQLRELEERQAAMRERERIMADLHDGLGASLVSLLSLVQAGKVALRDVEQRVHGALVELRLAVDSLEAPEGDLPTALGTVRYRMRDALEASGIRLEWRVADVSPLDYLTPVNLLHLQRFVLEMLNNALRHSGARSIAVSAEADAGTREVVLTIADDGRGFDPPGIRPGKGIATARRRAAALGAQLAIDSRPGHGTRVTLRLPQMQEQAGVDAQPSMDVGKV